MLDKIKALNKEYGTVTTVKKVKNRFLMKYVKGRRDFSYTPSKNEHMERSVAGLMKRTDFLISIVVPLYNTDINMLSELLSSVKNQSYKKWELVLYDASDDDNRKRSVMIEIFKRQIQNTESRLVYKKAADNKGISENTNEAIKLSGGEYIGLLDHDDLLHPFATYYMAKTIFEKRPDFIYSDELSFEGTTDRVQSVHLKPDFAWESFRNNNYICHFCVFERELFDRVGGFRSEYDGSQDYDLFLRMAGKATNIYHIPRVLYFWRLSEQSVAAGVSAKNYAVEAGRKALEDFLKSEGLKAAVSASDEYGPFYTAHYTQDQKQNVVICCENDSVASYIRQDISNLEEDWLDISISTGVSEKLTELAGESKERTTYIFVRKGFTFTEDCGGGAWIKEIIDCLTPKDVFMAGSVTYTESNKVKQAGYNYEKGSSLKIKAFGKNFKANDPGYMNRLKFRQSASLLGGGIIALKVGDKTYPIIKEICQAEAERVFSLRGFMNISAYLSGLGELSVVTPFAAMIDESDDIQRDFIIDKKYADNLLEKDRLRNPLIRKAGKYCGIL